MKTEKIFLVIAMVLGFFVSASAQSERGSDLQNEEIQDKIQQEPTREQQIAIENAARQSNVNSKSNQNERQAEDKLTSEKERSTGKDSKNPAETNPTTVKPARMSDPVSAPPNSGNR
jgi:hypothetical protein